MIATDSAELKHIRVLRRTNAGPAASAFSIYHCVPIDDDRRVFQCEITEVS